MFDRGRLDHLLQGGSEIFDDQNGFGARVLELMLKLARRVQRIDVDHDHAGAQDAEYRDWILQQVRHHDRHAVTLGESRQRLQEGGKLTGPGVKITVGDGAAEVRVSRQVLEFFAAILEQVLDRGVGAVINLCWNAFRVLLEPDFIGHALSPGYQFKTRFQDLALQGRY